MAATRRVATFPGQTAIAGIGATEFSKSSGRSELRLACEAVMGALDDAGLRPSDVDVACSLRPRWQDRQRQKLHEEERRELRESRFANTVEWVYWPEFEILRFLRSRSRGLSIHLFDEWIRENTTYEMLYDERRGRSE